MNRKALVKIHVLATILSTVIIGIFFISSLVAEVKGDEVLIRTVKTNIFYSLPLILLLMPTLAISGNRLAGNSKNPVIQQKKRRMKMIMINGILLVTLAIILFYQANFKEIDLFFYYTQMVELILGFSNLTLMGFNIHAGLKLSAVMRKSSKSTTPELV